MNLAKSVFTTFEAAKICGANITSIKNWIEKGELSAFRTPGGHFRIERDSLSSFLDRHDMPNPLIDDSPIHVVAIHADTNLVRSVSDRLSDVQMSVTSDPFDGLIKSGLLRPRAVILDSGLSVPAEHMVAKLSKSTDLDTGVVVVGFDDHDHRERLLDAGAKRVVKSNPVDLLQALLETLSA